MKLSEFVLTKTGGQNSLNWKYWADVSVTTGRWWWKQCQRRTIHRSYGGYWFFVDTGEYTPANQAETLERAYRAQHEE
jgi:hypothetical protein